MALSFVKVVVKWTGKAESKSRRLRNARLNALRRGAAYLWRVARNSIKEGKRREKHSWLDEKGRLRESERWVSSRPGKPPFQHGSHWRDSFRFAVDEESLTAYVGPVSGNRGIAPVHEFGQPAVVKWQTWRFEGYRQAVPVENHRVISFPRRPTMAPALERSKARLAGFWKGVISS